MIIWMASLNVAAWFFYRMTAQCSQISAINLPTVGVVLTITNNDRDYKHESQIV